MTQLTVTDLAARRGEDLLFREISFSLRSGEAMVITGANGSGKSTLIRVMAGLLSPESGSVAISVANQPVPRAAEACHYLGHSNAMKREMTVGENLHFWKHFFGDFEGGSGCEPEEAAGQLGLAEILHLPFGYLSAGQQRRMAMARLLCAWRPVWLLDEPTAALDVQSEKLFGGLMKTHLAKGGIVIAATHQELGLDAPRSLVMKGFEYAEEMI